MATPSPFRSANSRGVQARRAGGIRMGPKPLSQSEWIRNLEAYRSENGWNMREHRTKRAKIALFGHFDSTNFGNESTLQAFLYHLRLFQPDAEVTCISTGPGATVETYHIEAIPIAERFINSWTPQNLLMRVLRRICVGLPTEAYQWVKGLIRLGGTDMLIVPGTGLLTDADGLFNWGPYGLFKWSLIAKVCRCKLLLVSVGAGPIYGTLGRWFVKSILSLADFRSFRDTSTKDYLKGIGCRTDNALVYPDLAFSLPEAVIPRRELRKSRRSVIGLGVMVYAGKYSVATSNDTTYPTYLETLVRFVKWLLNHEFDVRLLSGDLPDMRARQEFMVLLRDQLSVCDEGHIIDEPIYSVESLLSQIVATDIVVATRFHNALLALLCDKPVISISFHNKCESLMSAMGLSEYCLDINDLKADRLIEKFCQLEANSDIIKPSMRAKVREFREALDEQYKFIFDDRWS
jgi:polysaccharide pyruvyl transferase WcaK-like protein